MNPGRSCSSSMGQSCNLALHITQKRIGKLSISINALKLTCDAFVVTSLMTGINGCSGQHFGITQLGLLQHHLLHMRLSILRNPLPCYDIFQKQPRYKQLKTLYDRDQVSKILKDNLALARDRMKAFSDKHRTECIVQRLGSSQITTI